MALHRGHYEVAELLKKKLREPLKEDSACIVCLDRRPDVVLIPCGHKNMCGACAYQWSEEQKGCPMDRTGISDILSLSPMNSGHRMLLRWERDERLGDNATIGMILFSNKNHPNLKTDYPEWRDRIKQMAKIWKSLTTEERKPYQQQARENRKSKSNAKI